jgi:hypothetical protein
MKKRWSLQLFFICIVTCGGMGWGEVTPSLEKALEWYKAGEKASAAHEKEEHFNKALEAYTRYEMQHEVESAPLLYNIGNTYFHLGQYGWARYYYRKALTLDPRDAMAEHNLAMATEAAGIETLQKGSSFISSFLFFFHRYFSFYERDRLASLLCLGGVVAFSCFLWRRNRAAKKIGCFCASGVLLMAASMVYQHFFSPCDAIIVKASLIHRDAGEYYATLPHDPLLAGEEVVVIGKKEEWVRVMVDDGTIGFVYRNDIQSL